MLNMAKSTMRKHLSFLVEKQWLEQRKNPNNSWDRTIQYRVNLIKLRDDLEAIGYHLENFYFDNSPSSETELLLF